MNHEIRGFVGRNGHGDWCWFAHRLADGVVLTGELLEAVEQAAGREAKPEELPDVPESWRP